MLWIGNKKIGKLYIGDKPIAALYIGARKVWSAISSCFGSGLWRNLMPWRNNDAWRN